MAKNHAASIKNDEQYEKLREKGMSKEKAARIANADSSQAGRKGEKSPEYEEWNKEQLYDKAKEVGIGGRSKIDKKELIQALRDRQ